MLKKSITYTDYDGNKRTENFYFNLNKAEILEMEMTTTGGMEQMVNKIIAEQDNKALFGIFKEIIMKSYGERTPDGKRFVKSKELTDSFMQTEAYSNLVMEFFEDSKLAADFINGIVPQDMLEEAKKQGLVLTDISDGRTIAAEGE